MPKIVEEEKKVFPKEPIDKDLLLGSIRDFQPNGVVMGVEKVIEPKRNMYGKVTISAILTIIGNMEKCRKYILDGEGQYTMYHDEKTGEERRDIEVADANLCTVFFPFYAVPKGEGLDEDTPLLITPGTSSYSFFNTAFINAEELTPKHDKAFETTVAELKEVLNDFTFKGMYAEGGTKRKFPYLKCELVEEI